MNAVQRIAKDDIRLRLRRAYASEVPNGYDSENVFARLLQGHGGKHEVLGIRESRIVEGSYLLRDVRALLSRKDLNLIDAYYTIPANGRLWGRKENRCALVAEVLYSQLGYHKWYTADVVREWARQRRHHNDKWWASHLFKTQRQLHAWRHGSDAKIGILPALHAWLDGVEDRVEDNIS